MEEFTLSEDSMQVFPNPAQKEVNVSWNTLSDGQIILSDLNGKVLKTKSFTQADRMVLSVEGLAQGTYLLTRQTLDGNLIETKTIIIK